MSTQRVDDVCAWARIRSCICRVATQGFHITICLRWNIQRYTPLTLLLSFFFIHVRSKAYIRLFVSLLCFRIQWIFTSVILSHRKSFVAIERFSASNVFVCAHSLCVCWIVWCWCCWCCRVAECEMGPWIYFLFFALSLSLAPSHLLFSVIKLFGKTIVAFACLLYLFVCSSLLLLLLFLHFLLMAFLAIDNR